MVSFLALLSSFVWGGADFFGGLTAKRFHPVLVVALSQLGGMVAALAFFGSVSIWGTHGSSPAWTWMAWGIAAGLAGVMGLLSLYEALASGTMGVVSPITALGALVPVALGIAGGDHWGMSVGFGLVIALIGAVLASGPELSGDVGGRPVVLAVIAAIAFGFSLYCMGEGSHDDLSGTMLMMRCASLSLLFPTLLTLRAKGKAREKLTVRDFLILPLIGAGDLSANMLFAAAASRGQVSMVAVLGSLYPVATLILAAVILHERLRRIQLAGVALSIAGVILATAA